MHSIWRIALEQVFFLEAEYSSAVENQNKSSIEYAAQLTDFFTSCNVFF